MAVDAACTAERWGLPALEPAVPLWSAMGLLEPSALRQYRWSGRSAEWMGDELWAGTKPVRAVGGRAAQERLVPAVISQGLACLSSC